MSPLYRGKQNIKKNFAELIADNKKKGKAKGMNGKPRNMAQIRAIVLSTAFGKNKTKKKKYA